MEGGQLEVHLVARARYIDHIPEPSTVPGRVEGGGQPVPSFEQYFILFSIFLCFLRSLLGVLSFACSSPAGGMHLGVSGLLLLLLFTS